MIVKTVEYPSRGTLETIEATSGKGKGAIPLTPKLQPATSVNVVLYYHGHHVTKGQDFGGFLKSYTTADLIAGALASGKAFAMGIPDLGANSDAKDWVSPKDSFDSFIGDILLVAAQRANELRAGQCLKDPSKDYRTEQPILPLALGNLILAAHSGGGYALYRTVAVQNSGLLANLKELWMFDCLYDGGGASSESWKKWAKHHGSIGLRIAFTMGSKGQHVSGLNSKKLDGLPSIRSFQENINHHKVPGNNIGPFVRDCPYL